MKHLLFPLAVIGLAAAAHAQAPAATGAAAPFTVQETGKSFYRLDDAIKSANGGDATIVIAPGTYHDCGVVEKGRVAFRAKVSGSVILDTTTCEGKAALVLRGTDAMVDGITFQNMHVSDGNGAGIRLEQGDLTVMNAVFRSSDEGILSADDPQGTIRVDRSTFSGLGSCAVASGCAHGLYIGHYGKLYVTRSRFQHGTGGHYLKARAAFVSITDDSFDDSHGQKSNYLIDLPSGATGLIARDIFVDGPSKENHSAIIAVAAEERVNPSAGLTITGNTATLSPGADYSTVFVADWSHEPLKISGNQLGKGIKPFEQR